MITGRVYDGPPWVEWQVEGHSGATRTELLVDTGFEGDLALQPGFLHVIGAALVAYRTVLMADGSERYLAHYEVVITGTRVRAPPKPWPSRGEPWSAVDC